MEFRPAVLWSWNGKMTEGRIRSMLRDFAARHIGGVFVHPRPGLVTEYLSEEWFTLWAVALEESKHLGMGCHIYDENSFPSGFAGGHVLAANPLAGTSRLTGHWVPAHVKTEKASGCRMGFLAKASSTSHVFEFPAGEAIPECHGAPVLALDLENLPSSLWLGGFPMADVCRTDVVGQFIALTHEAYSKRFSDEFGESIRYVFTDEPETGTTDQGFHMSREFLHAFRAEHGYSLEFRLADLCGSGSDSTAVRHDYFCTLNRLFTENFSRRVSEWCELHCLKFTGHFLENKWPLPIGSPSTMAAQQWMHAPGIDLLGFQFDRSGPGDNALWLLTIKEATSIAAQCGRSEVVCESSGGGGYGFGPAEMKPLEDFLLALGINRFVPHLAHESLAGVRKYDWPQTLSDHSPWWDAYGSHALHISRANYLLSQGTERNRTLVLHPTTTGWLHFIPACFHWPGETPHTRLLKLRDSYSAFLADLYSAQVDFDLGDESVMARIGSVNGEYLTIGNRSYATVVVPAGMENMLGSTVRLLEEFLSGGGLVLCAGDAPAFVNGRLSAPLLLDSPMWRNVGGQLIGGLRKRHQPRLMAPDGSPLPSDLIWRHSQLSDGSAILFFSNPTRTPISTEVAVEGSDIVAFDTQSGLQSRLAGEQQAGRIIARLTLSPGEHALWWVPLVRQVAPHPRERLEWGSTPLVFCGCEPLEPNVVPLDFCDYSGPAAELRNVSTLATDRANWHAQGFEQNLWRVSIQFRRAFLDAKVRKDSGFTLRYPFHVSERLAVSAEVRELSAAVERPWLYEISCNGIPISQNDALPWFDEDTRLLRIGNAVVQGTNIIELHAPKFHVLAEVMPVFLQGQFRALPGPNGFLLEPVTPWNNGRHWGMEGWPFYPWKTVYRYIFTTESESLVRVALPEFEGSAVGVRFDDSPLNWSFQHGRTIEHPFPMPAGDHTLAIVLCGNLKNLLGPHFHDGLPGAWSWENCPTSQPDGTVYKIEPTGLACAPLIETTPT